MDELLKMIMKTAVTDAVTDAIKNGLNVKGQHAKKPEEANIELDAKKLAKENKILFDAYIAAGFTEEQAIQVIAANNELKGKGEQ